MAANYSLLIRPFSWSFVIPRATSAKRNPNVYPSIQLFGYTSDQQSIYVRIPLVSTFVVKLNEKITPEIKENLSDIFSSTNIRISPSDPSTVLIRSPSLSPLEEITKESIIDNWEKTEKDPHGHLQSFWEATKIKPYDWMVVESYRPLTQYTSCDFNIMTTESNVRPALREEAASIPIPNSKIFFWDIETFASRGSEFPLSSNPDDYIFMISVITMHGSDVKSYVLFRSGVDTRQLEVKLRARYEKDLPFILIPSTTEKDLLQNFFKIYTQFEPDRQVYYNGDFFDMPYLINRLRVNNLEIPALSKIPSLKLKSSEQIILSPFGRDMAETIHIPGTEIIDLLYFYRRFYPYFKNHRLDTVATKFLGEGKTDLTIDEMMHAVRHDDLDELVRVVDYSFIDSLRMEELWRANNIENELERVCNNLSIPITNFLHQTNSELLNQAMFNIDFSSIFNTNSSESPKYIHTIRPGIYHDVYIYDYSELYRQIMLRSSQPAIRILAARLQGAPSNLIVDAFYSKYVDRTHLLAPIENEFKRFRGSNTIISIEPTIIRSIRPIQMEFLRFLNRYSCYIAITASSTISLDEDGIIQSSGKAGVCRPDFPLAQDVINEYVQRLCSNTLDSFQKPIFEEIPLDKFVMVSKLENIRNYASGSLKYNLAYQYGEDIMTSVNIKYVNTINGPKILEQYNGERLDYKYYINTINKYLQTFQKLKDFRPLNTQ